MALITLYLQRRDQRRVALSEAKTTASVTEDSHKGAEPISSEKLAQIDISQV